MAMTHQLMAGTILYNRYRIDTVLGQGGFGITYSGYDTKVGCKIAIKEYYPMGYASRSTSESNSVTIIDKNHEAFIRKGMQGFLNEARVLAKFKSHPGVVSVRDYFEENDTAYIIMELLEGINLKQQIKKQLFTPDEIIDLLDPVLSALEQIHENGVIHRDISPDNIILLKDGTAKLMDFGAARLSNIDTDKSLSIVLKNGYAPEEQYRSRGKQGPWTDIYALCATIYKCITGITPDSSLERERFDELKTISELGIKISYTYEQTILKGLSVHSEDRFQSVTELKGAFKGEYFTEPEDDETVMIDDEDDDGTVMITPAKDDFTVSAEENKIDINDEKDNTIDVNHITTDENSGKSSEKSDAPGKKSITKYIIIALVCTCVLMLGVLFVWQRSDKAGSSGKKTKAENLSNDAMTANNQEKTEQNVEAAKSEEALETENTSNEDAEIVKEDHEAEISENANHENMYRVVFLPNGEITINGFTEAARVMSERLDTFLNKDDYELNMNGTDIEVYVKKECFDNAYRMEYIMNWFVASKFNNQLIYRALNDAKSDYDSIIISNMADYIEKAEIVQGIIPNFDVNGGIIGNDIYIDGKYPYIEITFTEDFWREHGEAIKAEDADIHITAANTTKNGAYIMMGYYPKLTGERTLAIYTSEDIIRSAKGQEPIELKILLYNLTHDPLEMSFDFYTSWDDKDWQKKSDGWQFGANQCEVNEMPENAISLRFSIHENEVSEGLMLDIEEVLKARLDSLGAPYALARELNVNNTNSELWYYIKIPEEYAGSALNNLIAIRNPKTRILAGPFNYEITDTDSVIVDDKNGTITVSIDKGLQDKLNQVTSEMINNGYKYLAFEVDETLIMEADLREPVKDGVIVFDKLMYEEGYPFLLNLVKTIEERDYPDGIFMEYDDMHFANDSWFSIKKASEMGMKPLINIDEIQEDIRNNICDTAEVSYQEDKTGEKLEDCDYDSLNINLHLILDGNFVDNITKMTNMIYTRYDFKNLPYLDSIRVIYTDLDDVTNEKAHSYYSRKNRENLYEYNEEKRSAFSDYTNLYVYAENGRIEKYADEIKGRQSLDRKSIGTLDLSIY